MAVRPALPLKWDPVTGRYRDRFGRFIPTARVRAELDKSLQVATRRVQNMADELRQGRMTLEEWRLEMRRTIKDAHLRSSAIARGGWAQMDASAYGRAGQVIRREYAYLENWVKDITRGYKLDGRMEQRSALYTQAARNTFHKVQEGEMIKRGVELERSVLHPAEHCLECIAEADAGWRPIGEMVPIGQRQCLRNCKCTIEYKRSA